MKAVLAFCVTVLVSIVSAGIDPATNDAKSDDWYFEWHNDASISNWVGSCYSTEYTYY